MLVIIGLCCVDVPKNDLDIPLVLSRPFLSVALPKHDTNFAVLNLSLIFDICYLIPKNTRLVASVLRLKRFFRRIISNPRPPLKVAGDHAKRGGGVSN